MTLTQLLQYYETLNLMTKPTQDTYQYVVRSFVVFSEKDPEIETIMIEQVAAYRTATLLKNTAVTFNSKRRHLIALFNLAVRQGFVVRNVFSDVKRAPESQLPAKAIARKVFDGYVRLLEPPKQGAPDAEEAEMFHPQWFWQTFVKTLYYTGMRKRQIVGLTWADVDLVEHSFTLRAATSKTRRQWKIPMPAELREHIVLLRERTLEAGRTATGAEQVFCLPLFSKWRAYFASDEMTGENVNKFFARFCKHLPEGSARLTAHRIRHTTATVLANNVRNLKAVQVLLGHTSFSTTLGYIHPDLEELRAAACTLAL